MKMKREHEILKAYYKTGVVEVGCDEAGRGCLAGPVFAAAVILPTSFDCELLNDSKQLTDKQRNLLRPYIEEHAIAWAVAQVSAKEIDKINILNASILAMHRALDAIEHSFEHIIVDGNRFKAYKQTPHCTIVKGDAKYKSIAAASILAKTHRDAYMQELAKKHPQYDWEHNMGYPTKKHRAGITQYGPTKHHRMSFKLLETQLSLNF